MPNKEGGWGLGNLFFLNKSLVANTLWRVLTKEGIWSNVINDKYLQINRWKHGSGRSLDLRGWCLRFGKK
jgi:hypothetical protein